MSAVDIDDAMLREFNAFSDDQHLTIVLGAGASVPSGLPTWDRFARALALGSGVVKSEASADLLLTKQDPTIVLEAARTQSGDLWGARLWEALYGDLPVPPRPSALHLAAAGRYLAKPQRTTLATLNFDTLLEQALAEQSGSTVTLDVAGVMESPGPTVHHLHGALLDHVPYSPVVTFRDFADLIAAEAPWQRDFLAQALERGPLLLAGTSYRDPDIRHWLHLIMRKNRGRNPALVTIVREGLGLSRTDFEPIRSSLTMEWEAINLKALTMEDLTDVAHVVRELGHVGTVGYKSPQTRTRELWRLHVNQFSRLQATYQEQLAQDLRAVTYKLETRGHRATLWIADGKGSIARFASDGGRLTGPKALKYVPTGHDSAWIAAEALSAEEVKLKDVNREQSVKPTWRSVLAVPVFVSRGELPAVASAVVTFGLETGAGTLIARDSSWTSFAQELSDQWSSRLTGLSESAEGAK